MTEKKRFKIYNKETLDTRIEDTMDCYSDGTPKSYWFGENEDFCDLFDKLNELNDENEQLKKQSIHFESEMYAYKGSEEYYKQLLIEKDEEIHNLKNALNKIKEIINEE